MIINTPGFITPYVTGVMLDRHNCPSVHPSQHNCSNHSSSNSSCSNGTTPWRPMTHECMQGWEEVSSKVSAIINATHQARVPRLLAYGNPECSRAEGYCTLCVRACRCVEPRQQKPCSRVIGTFDFPVHKADVRAMSITSLTSCVTKGISGGGRIARCWCHCCRGHVQS